MTTDGVSLVPLWSLPQTTAPQTMHSQTMQGGGATLPSNILTSLSLFSSKLLSIGLGLSLFPIEGEYFILFYCLFLA